MTPEEIQENKPEIVKTPPRRKKKIILWLALGLLILAGLGAVYGVKSGLFKNIFAKPETEAVDPRNIPFRRTIRAADDGVDLSKLKSNYKHPAAVEPKTLKTPFNLGGAEITKAYPNGVLQDSDEVYFVFKKDVFPAGGENSQKLLISIPELDGTERKLNGDTVKFFIESDMQYGKLYQGKFTYNNKSADFSFFKPVRVGGYYKYVDDQHYFFINVREEKNVSANKQTETIIKLLAKQLYIEAEKDGKKIQSAVGVGVIKNSNLSYVVKPTLNFPKNIKLTLRASPKGIVRNYWGDELERSNGYKDEPFTLEKILSDRRILSSIDFYFSEGNYPVGFSKHLKITPHPEGLDLAALSSESSYRFSGTRISIPTDLFVRGVTYNFVLSPDLQNSDGEKLNETIEFDFVPIEALPLLELESGINIVETKYPYYSYKMRNIATTNVSLVKVSKFADVMQYRGAFRGTGTVNDNKKYGRVIAEREVTANLDSHIWWQKIDLPGPGVYLINVAPSKGDIQRTKGLGIQARNTLVNVTNIGLVCKNSLQNLVVWATNLDTGTALPDAVVTAYDSSGKKLASAQTNSDGYCSISLNVNELEKNIFVVAQKDNDTAIISTRGGDFNFQYSVLGIWPEL